MILAAFSQRRSSTGISPFIFRSSTNFSVIMAGTFLLLRCEQEELLLHYKRLGGWFWHFQ